MRGLLVSLIAAAACGSSAGPGGGVPSDGAALDAAWRSRDAASPSDAAATIPDSSIAPGDAAPADGGAGAGRRGFPGAGPWVSFYGSAAALGDLQKVADTFRIINIDADPDGGNFTRAQIQQLQGGGRNRVISYFNLGSCENFRSYWNTAPAGLVSCNANKGAQRGAYGGYPDEVWMDVGNSDYQALLVEHVAPRLAAQGIDGFYFDNLEMVEHRPAAAEGPCDRLCSQGGLDLVRKLRERFPDLLFVMQNATSAVTREGKTGGLDFPFLLDGIAREEAFTPPPGDRAEQADLTAWKNLGLRPGGRPFVVLTEDYVGSCANSAAARAIYGLSRAAGFSPYATDRSSGQMVVCYWGF